MSKGETKAADYRARAGEDLAAAASAALSNVREQRQRSAAVWSAMAEAEEKREAGQRPSPAEAIKVEVALQQ